MSKIKLGSHNSMSYLKPKNLLMWPFKFMAKCQKVDITEQYKLGVRLFDLRISFTERGVPEFRHGAIAYRGRVFDSLKELNSLGKNIKVRVLLENSKYSKRKDEQEQLFKLFCTHIKNAYTNLKFFCGRRKYDWKLVYDFGVKDPQIVQKISSMTWKKWDDWYPWLYAKIMNKKNIAKADTKKWLLLDFVEIH